MFYQQQGLPFFKLGGIQVSVGMWYLLVMGMLVLLWPTLSPAMDFADGILIGLAVTVSLLVHEFAHALVAKRKKLGPSIILTAFGGYTLTEREAPTDGDDAKIVFAGPIAGMALAGAVALLFIFAPAFIASSPVTHRFFYTLLWFSLIWSVVNLALPIWPLDGGRLFHLFLRRIKPADTARRWTLQASLATMIPAGILGFLAFNSFLVVFFAIFVGMDNYRALQSGMPLVNRRGKGRKKKASSLHQDLLEEAEQAMAEEDWREAARLAHHMRSLGAMPSQMLEKVWIILGVATMNQDRFDEALRYLERAPRTSKVKRAIRQCEQHLDDR